MDEPIASRVIERAFTLDDIAIRGGGDGRTVVAYAAVFDTPAEITDRDGHYIETIDRSAFANALNRGKRPQVFYNHGKTLYGTPSERFSMPLGVPEEIKPDNRGLLTVTRYNKNELADEVLEHIRNGDITGQSFSGKTYRSKPAPAVQRGGLKTIHRTELGLTEYGPTPIPSYKDAGIVAVRMEELVDTFHGLTDEERQELLHLLGTSRSETPPPPADAAPEGTSADTDTPAPSHLSPTPAERRERALLLKGVTL